MSKIRPCIPAADVRAALEARLARQSRTEFVPVLADILEALGEADWQTTARDDPKKLVDAAKGVAQLAGYAEKTEHITKNYDMAELARILLARYGPDKLVTVWQSMQLPMSQLPEELQTAPEALQATTIEATSDHEQAPIAPVS